MEEAVGDQHTSTRMGISAGMWDTWAQRSVLWAVKEQLDNAFSKAETANNNAHFPQGRSPWNANSISLLLTQTDSHLIVADNGRGCSAGELLEGFAALGHTLTHNPQLAHNGTALSVFGTGSKMADACVATDAIIITKQQSQDSVLVARYGKDLSSCMQTETLQFVKSSVRFQQLQKLGRHGGGGAVKAEEDEQQSAVAQQLQRQLYIDDSMISTIQSAVRQCAGDPSFFVRVLRLREPEVLVAAGFAFGDCRASAKLAATIASNFLFPPVMHDNADDLCTLAQQLQKPDYYVKPYGSELYSPTVKVGRGGSGAVVDWAANPLLRFVSKGCKHSPVLHVDGDPERHGPAAGRGEPVARILLTYLTNDKPAVRKRTDKRLFAGETEENQPYCGVAVYNGARRICNPNQGHFWSMGGVADSYMEYARNVNAFSITHHTNRRQNEQVSCRDYLGEAALAKLNSMTASVFQAGDSTVLAFKGVHMAVVVAPGVLQLTEDKTQFHDEGGFALNLMLDALRMGISWMLDNPPVPLEDRYESYKRQELTAPAIINNNNNSRRQNKRARQAVTSSSGSDDSDSDRCSSPVPSTHREPPQRTQPARKAAAAITTTTAQQHQEVGVPASIAVTAALERYKARVAAQKQAPPQRPQKQAGAVMPLKRALQMLKHQIQECGQDPAQAIDHLLECITSDAEVALLRQPNWLP